jgi:LPS sulfotransferase NodH
VPDIMKSGALLSGVGTSRNIALYAGRGQSVSSGISGNGKVLCEPAVWSVLSISPVKPSLVDAQTRRPYRLHVLRRGSKDDAVFGAKFDCRKNP